MDDIIFNNNIQKLENIFGKTLVSKRARRLKEIYFSTENSWHDNLTRLKKQKIENILIAEAPPWSDTGIPRYFYNTIESKYHQSVWRAFYPNYSVPSDREQSYKMLADKNFLLVDSIPFSMKYSSANRHHSNYLEIITNSLAWLTKKLENKNLKLADRVKVAFAFKLNGLAVIKATGGQLLLKNNRVIELRENLIAADNSGYTNSNNLRKIYEL